jgi:hypothetical protein
MKKINHKILSLPPYISTSWKNINTLHMKEIRGEPTLVIVLHNGSTIEIPNLEPALVEQVFAAHGNFLEQESQEIQTESLKQYEPTQQTSDMPFSIGIPFQLGGDGNALDNFGALLHHNSEQANAPDLPPEILQKIAGISKALGMDLEQMSIPKAEPHCNCTYCQIARAIQAGSLDLEEEESEEVSEEDLKFRDWDIEQKSEEIYEVTNPIDQNEHYQVFLGNPVGCTCGKENCEHIRTVLNS